MVSGEPTPTAPDAQPCRACRGTGQVTSGLGGEPHQVTCPWCQGTGRRIPGIDAQEHPSEDGAAADSREDGAPAHSSADPVDTQ